MRILMMTFGSRGDVQPFIALGLALKARGHAVTLSASSGFEGMIEESRLDVAPLSVDVRALLATPEMQEALRTFRGKVHAWRTSKEMIRQQLQDTAAIVRDQRPDLIVYHPKSFAAVGMASELSIPALPSFLQPAYVATSAFPNMLIPAGNLGRLGNWLSHKAMLGLMKLGFSSALGNWRRTGNAPAMTGWPNPLQGCDPHGNGVPRLHAYSRILVPKPVDWGPREHITGYWFTEPEANWVPPPDLARFLNDGPPPIYVGFGSMPAKDAGRLTRAVLEALDRTKTRGVLATGWGGLEAVASSNNVHVLEAAPHSWLFPCCAAIVHHGGAGTTHEALRWGRPSIICPVFGDQPVWARRVAALGAGPKPIPQKRPTAEALAAAILQTRNQAMIDRAAAIGKDLRREPGAKGAAKLIDEWTQNNSQAAAASA